MNFKDTTRHEVAGHSSEFAAVTTAAIVECPGLPPTGLNQSMHNPSVPLALHDILEGPAVAGDNHGPAITRGIIAMALHLVHTPQIKAIYEEAPELYPEIPVLERIPTKKTNYWQLGGIIEDEGTGSGTYKVHENIMLKQLKLSAPADPNTTEFDDFKQRLWLMHGDAATTMLIRSVKAAQQQAKRPFDKRDWLLSIPSWFHIQMNLLYTIVCTHWEGPTHEQAHHCLKADSTTWGRTQYSPENIKYHLVEPIVTQSFASRVLILFYAAMRRRGLLQQSETTEFITERIEHAAAAVSRLGPRDFLNLVEDIRITAFTLDAWDGRRHDGCSHGDVEFRTMCRMLQEIEMFLTLRHAVKWGDIGLLRRLVDPLIIVFFGASQYNYGREMLYYRWLLSPANSTELQYSILASGLVNWRGRPDTFKPIDLSLEHLNCACKNEMKCYKNSTKDIGIIFDRVCLTNTWIRILRFKLEKAFAIHMPDAHTAMNAVLDIFALASNLWSSGLAELRQKHELHGSFFDSADVLQIGISQLADRMETFNQQHVRRIGGSYMALPTGVQHDPLTAAEAAFIDIDEYVDSIERAADTVDLTESQ